MPRSGSSLSGAPHADFEADAMQQLRPRIVVYNRPFPGMLDASWLDWIEVRER
jgi:hypothetical protein